MDEFVVIGSQAILGTVPVVPESMLVSMEAEIYPLREPDRGEEVGSAIGDDSPFQRTYRYHAHGVGPETAKLPQGWEERCARVEIEPRLKSARKPIAYSRKSTT